MSIWRTRMVPEWTPSLCTQESHWCPGNTWEFFETREAILRSPLSRNYRWQLEGTGLPRELLRPHISRKLVSVCTCLLSVIHRKDKALPRRSCLKSLYERTFLAEIKLLALLFMCIWQKFLEFSIPWNFGVLFWSESRWHLSKPPLPIVELPNPFLLWAGLPAASQLCSHPEWPLADSSHSSPGLTFSCSGLCSGCPLS